MEFPTAHAILAIHNHPHCGEPLVQTEGGILDDRSGLEGELWGIVLLAAVPAVVLFKEQDVLAAATRADNAIGPATGDKVFAAIDRIGEVQDRFLQARRFHA